MAYLAGVYPRLKFGATVLCQSYRNPALLAKTMANLQLLCGGRLLFGIGAGWLEREYAAYGYEFPEPAVRIAQLDETVEIVKRMWTQPRATFHGKHYRIEEAICEPKPDPIPPILIGGGGEKLTLRVVAKHADWWNFPGGTRENYARKLEVLRRHCDAVGTDYAAIRKTWSPDGIAVARTEAEARRIGEASPYASNPVVGTPDQVAEQLRAWVEIGVTYFIVRLLDFPRSEGIELFAHEVMPRLARA
jgi:alkanesulfonate monooxygenase SsuD/methylene tetrahydromethanopterin reductase-like flavin-dependent oxidoreductase (luciferase family)